MNKKRMIITLLISLIAVISISSTGIACNKHMTMAQFFEADRKAGITNAMVSRERWEIYVRMYCDEYKPNPKRRGWVTPWGVRYCPRCGAKGDYIGDYDSYGIQVVFECQYAGCGFRWLVRTDVP